MAGGYTCKVYIVQKASGEVIAAKTAFQPAHAIAKAHAPAKILFSMADKTFELNVSAHDPEKSMCK